MTPNFLSTINGFDALLFLAAVGVVVGWLYDRDRWRIKVRDAEDSADRWAARAVEAQEEVERLRASVAAEVEVRLDAAVEAALGEAERAQSAEDRVEALARAVRHRLELEGLGRWRDLDGPAASTPWAPDADTLPNIEAVPDEEGRP